MRRLLWTRRAREDLASIRAYIGEGSPHYAALVIGRIISVTENLIEYPEFGRRVPEIMRSDVREIVHKPYRIVYRIVSPEEIHIVTVHHAAMGTPNI